MNTLWFILKLALFIWVLFWVLKHIRIVVVQEATAVAFKYLGRYVYQAMEYMGHSYDPNGDIVRGSGKNSMGSCWCIWRWGGWVFYISPLVRPARYTDTNETDSFGDGIYIRLNQIAPEPALVMAETTEDDGASVPLNIKFVTTMVVKNPYKWLFVSPRNVNVEVAKRLETILRSWVKKGSEKHAQSMKGNGERLWKELVEEPANPENPAPDDPALNCGPTIKKMKKDWGLEIVENSIMAQDIGYDPDYQQAMQAKSKADLIADGDVQATAGRVIKTVAESAGLTVEQLKIKLSGDPTLRGKSATEGGFKEAFSFAEDIVKRDRAGDLTDLRIGSVDGTPINGDLAGAAAFATLFGRGGGNKGRRNDNRGKDQNSPPQKRPEQMNDEELQEWADEQKKGKKSIF